MPARLILQRASPAKIMEDQAGIDGALAFDCFAEPPVSSTLLNLMSSFRSSSVEGKWSNAPDVKDGHLLLFVSLPMCIEVIGVLGATAHSQINSTSCFESLALR